MNTRPKMTPEWARDVIGDHGLECGCEKCQEAQQVLHPEWFDEADTPPPNIPEGVNAQHTPGPWRISDRQAVVADHATGHDDPENIKAYGGHLVAESIARPANIRLIAAAPELVEALEDVYRPGTPAHSVECPRMRGGDHESCNCKPGRARALLARIHKEDR